MKLLRITAEGLPLFKENRQKTHKSLAYGMNAVILDSRNVNEICRLETIITSHTSKSEGVRYNIVSETIWTKNVEEVTTRKSMLNFDGYDPTIIRSSQEEFLSDDVRIMIARNKKKRNM